MSDNPYVDAFHSNASNAASVDPNTGLPATTNEVNPQPNGSRAGESQAYVDAWAENPTGNPPVRTWTDPSARPQALPGSGDINHFLADHQGMTDAQIAQNMQKYGVSPEAFAEATGMDAGQVSQRYQAATGAAWNPKFSTDYLAAWHDSPANEVNSLGLPVGDTSTTTSPVAAPPGPATDTAPIAPPAPAPTPAPTPAPAPSFQDYFDAGPGEGGGGPGDGSGVGSAGSTV